MQTIGSPGHAEMYPSGLDVGSGGSVFVADTGGDAVAAYGPTGTLLWRVGTRGPKTLNSFVDPRDVAKLNGLVYVADTGNHRVVVLDAGTGAGVSQWATGGGSPLGISAGVDGAGHDRILVTLDNQNKIVEYTPGGSATLTIGGTKGSLPGELNAPRDAATNAAGDVYVADYLNDRISEFAADGTFIRTWGTTGGTNGNFARPYGVDVDEAGNVYVADSNNNRIQKFGPSGNFLGKFGSVGDLPGQFTQLRRVAVGSGATPQIYAADLWGYRIERFDQALGYQQTWGGTPPPPGLFNEPSGVSVSGSDIWVADTVNQRINRYSAKGRFELSLAHRGWGKDLEGVAWPRDVAADPVNGTVWIADTKNSRLLEFTEDGVSTGRTIGRQGVGLGQFSWPSGLAVAGGRLYVADTNNNRVVAIDPSGPTVLWSTAGMSKPSAVTVDGAIVYVADTGNMRIVRLNITTGAVVGTIVNSLKLHSPQGVAIEADGDIWVADTTWNKLVQFDESGLFLRSFGSFGAGTTQFNNPTHLAIAGRHLYVADQWNDRVQVFDLGRGA